MDNNILQSQCNFNNAFDNKESNELDKLARQVNNKNIKNSNFANKFHQKFGGIVCDQLDCVPYSQPLATNDNGYSFFSAQGDYSPLYAPIEKNPTKKNKSKSSNLVDTDNSSDNSTQSGLYGEISNGSTFDTIPKKYKKPKRVLSESDSFQSMSSEFPDFDENSLSSTYSSLPLKIKKKLRMSSNHLKNNKNLLNGESEDQNDIAHLKSCNDCRSKLLSLLENAHLLNFTNSSSNQTNLNKKNEENIVNKQIKNNPSFLNLTNPELKDIMVLILIGVIIIMLIDIFVRQ